jgi:hypothetical protein
MPSFPRSTSSAAGRCGRIRLMALGFFKKLVVADYLSTFVNRL